MRVFTEFCAACREDKVMVQMTREEAGELHWEIGRAVDKGENAPSMPSGYFGILSEGISRELVKPRREK
jgi:hypothetical protein